MSENAQIEAEAKKQEAKAKAAEKQAAKAAEMTEAANIAAGIRTVHDYGRQEIRYIRDLKPWSENPRHIAPDDVADSALRDSLIRDGVPVWDARYPAVIFPDNRVIQGNRRLAILAEYPDLDIPVIVYDGPESGALLLALQDVGTGVQEKGIGDFERVVCSLMRTYALTAHTISAYLWQNSRELLFRIAPASRKAGAVADAQKNAYGRMQTLQRVANLPLDVQEQIFSEHNAGVRKGKIFDGKMIAQLAKCDGPEACQRVINEKRAELERPKDPKAPDRLTGRIMADRRASFTSATMREIAALFDKPDGERNALEILDKIDIDLASKGQ